MLCVEGQGLLRSETNVSPKGTLPRTVMELMMKGEKQEVKLLYIRSVVGMLVQMA